jgi:hypothetical protein
MGYESFQFDAAICSTKHLYEKHKEWSTADCFVKVNISHQVWEHISRRHGPYKRCNWEFDDTSVFFPGFLTAIAHTLYNPDNVLTTSRLNMCQVAYFKTVDFPIGIDRWRRDMYTCKVVVDIGKNMNTIVTAYPLDKYLKEKCQTRCTPMCGAYMMDN